MTKDGPPLLRYCVELRKRLLRCLCFFISLFAGLLYFANGLYNVLALPLLKQLPKGHGLIATHLVSPFFVPVELSFFTALFLSVPFFLYQLWAFVAPALYVREKKTLWRLLVLSVVLFYLGVLFAYWALFPLLFAFLAHTTPTGVLLSPDIAQYLDFTLKLFFVLGSAFEVPVLVMLLLWTGAVTRQQVIQARPYAIVGSFVVSMLLAPPDVISQTVIALPIWFLFEIGILLAPFVITQRPEGLPMICDKD